MTRITPMPPTPAGPTQRWSPLKVAVQVAGFAVGLALFGWCVALALRPQNRESLERLMQAPVWVFASLLVCAILSLLLNGSLFWVLMRPVRCISWVGVFAVNAVATSLNYLPFKLSVVSRFVIHNRRDGLPLTLILAWLGAAGVVILGAIFPPIVATIWRARLDIPWVAVTGVGLAAACAMVIVLARVCQRAAAKSLVGRFLALKPIKPLTPGLEMLADPKAVTAAFALRTLDIACVAARFWLAAHACGTPITPGTALIAACTYFLIGVVTPAGALGAREGGTTLLAGTVLQLPDVANESFAVVALVASASEMVVNLASAALSAAWLRFAPTRRSDPISTCTVEADRG